MMDETVILGDQPNFVPNLIISQNERGNPESREGAIIFKNRLSLQALVWEEVQEIEPRSTRKREVCPIIL